MGKITSVIKKVLSVLALLLVTVVLVVGAYFAYVFISYNRIPDNQPVMVDQNAKEKALAVGESYTMVTQNVGFGAYIPDFTFFMDGGKESRGRSKEIVKETVDLCAKTLKNFNPDFMLLQEVDTDSTRAFYIDQNKQIQDFFPSFSCAFAQNYHSPYLMYPILKPHGASKSGIGTYSRFAIQSALRRQLVISTGFSKLLDYDRAFSLSRVEVENGRELVIFNVHLSAYGADASIKENQMKKLFADMSAEYEKGNYVICGGDFNADFTGTSVKTLNKNPKDMGWTKPFFDELIPAGFTKCVDYSDGKVTASARDVDIPYGPDCFTVIVDGFLVSDNVDVNFLQIVDTGFAYSDHNPVVMKFALKN